MRPFTVGNAAHHRSGTGLSLSLARAIVEAHGGAPELASDGPGRGALRQRAAAPGVAVRGRRGGAADGRHHRLGGLADRDRADAGDGLDLGARAARGAACDVYAKDFKRVVELERVRRQALEAAQLQLERYATDLNQATRAERERARHGGDAQRRALSLVMRVAGLTHAPTLAHQSRMEGYVLVLTRRLGWSVADTYALAAAAELHDLGLCKVPLAILDQADPLDVPSLEVLRRHPVSGAELLAGDDSPFGALARSVARHHHERWDGSGYPGRHRRPGHPAAGAHRGGGRRLRPARHAALPRRAEPRRGAPRAARRRPQEPAAALRPGRARRLRAVARGLRSRVAPAHRGGERAALSARRATTSTRCARRGRTRGRGQGRQGLGSAGW
ncbi:MAG: HD domain-containing protein [Myxococcota bacterium]